MTQKELSLQDIMLAVEKLKEHEAPLPYKQYFANDGVLQYAIEYFSDNADVVVVANDGRRFCKGKVL